MEPVFKCVDIRSSLDELRRVSMNDTQKLGIEITSQVSPQVPRFVAVEENLFLQVMINLLRMAMDTIVNRGYIRLSTLVVNRKSINNLVIDFVLSTCKLDDRERQTINRLSYEKDFKRILSADVEPHFKIAKILCNKLGWRIEFDTNRDFRYKLFVPLLQQPSPEDELALAEEDFEVGREVEDTKPTPGINQERIIASQQSQRNKNKKYLEQADQNRSARPLTVDESYVRRNKKYFEPVQEEPEGIEDLDEGLQHMNSSPPLETQSYREDGRSDSCPTVLLMNSS